MTFNGIPSALLLCPFIATLMAIPAFAEQDPLPNSQERRTTAAERLAPGESITLDGNFDEPVWRRAQVAADFVQIDPDNGQPPTEQTEFRIAFDARNIYIGVICHDSQA